MANYNLTLLLTALLLTGCTGSPEKPPAGAALPPCGPLPNCVNSESGSGGKAIDAIQASPRQWQALKSWIAGRDNWSITVDDGDFVQAVTTTPLMRYRDDVMLRFDSEDGVIQVRSSSRLGISDMGANRERVERLRELVNLEQAKP